MNCTVHSELSVCGYKCDKPHIVVSITSPEDNWPRLPDNPARLDILRLKFHDVSKIDDYTAKWLASHDQKIDLFEPEHAAQIKAFLLKYPEADLIVNCQAGISRSSAVAAAVTKWKGGDESVFFNPDRYHPNSRVYDHLLHALQKPD